MNELESNLNKNARDKRFAGNHKEKSSRIQWLQREEFMSEAIKKIKPVLIGFDIGIGIVPHDYLKATIYVCCEPYKEYVDVLTEKISQEKDRIYVIQQKDWFESISGLKDKSIDSVYLIDVIEHLSKEEGMKLLKMTEKIVRKQIVIFTPIGVVRQEVLAGGKDAWGLNGAEYQEHKSGWMPEDFDEKWDIYACKDFHNCNNIGEKLKTPFGAFWAIKNFNIEDELANLSSQSLPVEIKDALFNQFPYKYFETIKDIEKKTLQHQQLQNEHQQLQNEHQQLQNEHQQLQNEHQQLQSTHERLVNCRAVRYGNIIKKYLKIINIE